MIDINKIAENAQLIVNGYAFTKEKDKVKVLNLNNTEKASLLSLDGTVLETSMDDIELSIITNYYKTDYVLMDFANA